MATGTTRLTDLVTPAIFYDYLHQQSTKTSALIKSGVFARSPDYNDMAGSKGTALSIPFTRPLTERSRTWKADGSNDTTAEKLISGQMTVPLLKRRHKLGWNDLAMHIAGITDLFSMGKASWGYQAKITPGDNSSKLLMMLTNLWNEDIQQTLISILTGMFASVTNVASVADASATGLAGLNLDVAITSSTITALNKINPQTLGKAASLLGDYGSRLRTMMVHPEIYYNGMLPSNITPSLQTSSQDWQVPTYLDYQVILDDTLPVDRTLPLYPKYTTYVLAPGAVAFGDNDLGYLTGMALTRDEDQTEEYLHTRKAMIMQPIAASYVGPIPADGGGPTDAMLATAANWSRADSIKNIGIVRIVTNG